MIQTPMIIDGLRRVSNSLGSQRKFYYFHLFPSYKTSIIILSLLTKLNTECYHIPIINTLTEPFCLSNPIHDSQALVPQSIHHSLVHA